MQSLQTQFTAPAQLPGPVAPPAPEVSVHSISLVLRRRRWLILITFIVSVALIIGGLLLAPKKWESESQLVLLNQDRSANDDPGQLYEGTDYESIDTQMGLVQSDAMTSRAMDWISNNDSDFALWNKYEPNEDFEYFQKDYKFDNPPDSNVINVTVEGKSPAEAQMKDQAFDEAFINWKTEMARHDIDNTIDNLMVRLGQAYQQKQTAQNALTAFNKEHDIVDSDSQSKDVLNNLAMIEANVNTAQQNLAFHTAQMQALQNQLGTATASIAKGTGLRDDNLLLSLQTQLTQAEMDRANAAQQYRAAYPGVLSQDDAKIADLKRRIAQLVNGTVVSGDTSLTSQAALHDAYQTAVQNVAADQAQLSEEQSQLAAYKTKVSTLPQLNAQYVSLQSNSDMLNSLYNSLQSALNAARLDRDKISSDVIVSYPADMPDEDYPSFPTHKLIGALSLLGSLLITWLVVWLAETRFSPVEDVTYIRAFVPGPIVGLLPALSKKQVRELSTSGYLPPEFRERYNLALANIMLAMRQPLVGSDTFKPIIMVTSSLPGEGKSMTAEQMARAGAAIGKRVILVNADMRKSEPWVFTQVKAKHTLLDVLAGSVAPSDALYPTDTPNLFVVPSGPSDASPIELITRQRFVDALRDYKSSADMVVIDTPAAGLVADALHIAPFADCILQVIGAGKVTEGLARDTIASIEAAAPNRMLFIVNNAAVGGEASAHHYYRAYFNHHNGNGNGNGHRNGSSEQPRPIALSTGNILTAPSPDAPESQEVTK